MWISMVHVIPINHLEVDAPCYKGQGSFFRSDMNDYKITGENEKHRLL